MKCNVPVAEATQGEGVLPERVQEALGQLVGAAKEGLLALCVSSPLEVSVAASSLLLEPLRTAMSAVAGMLAADVGLGGAGTAKLRLTQAHQMCRFLMGPHPAVTRWLMSLRATRLRLFGGL